MSCVTRGLRNLGLVVGLFLVATTAVVLARADSTKSPGHGSDGGSHKKAPHGAHAKHPDSVGEEVEHQEPNAIEHVLEPSKRGEWHLFETFPPKHIHLPFKLTKFMVLEVIAALLIAAIYIPLASRLRSGRPPRGGFENAFEVLLTFIRNEVAKPAIGHDADRFVPFLWTIFLFILFNNLLGLLPFGGSPTASIYVTAALALVVFFAIHGSAIAKMGFSHYLESMWPHMDVPIPVMGFFIKVVVCVIEVVGVLVRNMVLAVRLFANMFAGHMVLATILLFIKAAAISGFALWTTVTLSSVLGILALSLLELFVAFLQAYIFVFLTALFMGMAMHPQH